MLSNEFLLKGVATPALAGFAATLIFFRLTPGRRWVATIAFAVAQMLGTALAVWGNADWFPSRNLHWVPWVAVASAAIGPIAVASGLASIERWVLVGFASLAAAAVMVPDWPELWPARPVSIISVVAAMTCIARGTDAVTRRQPPRLVVLTMVGAALTAVALIAASLSLKLGESSLITAAALSGVGAALMIRPDESAIRGLTLSYALGVGGWCYVTAIEPTPPEQPLWALLFIPAAPLVLWLTAFGPLVTRSNRIRWMASTLLVAAYLAGVGAWTWFSTELETEDYTQASQRPWSAPSTPYHSFRRYRTSTETAP